MALRRAQPEPHGALPQGALPRGVLVSRWHQRLAVALDAPLEQLVPGAERLPAVLAALLDTQRATTVRPDPGAVYRSILEEDLRHLGAVAPARAAADLLIELDAVVRLEDAADRVLPAERAALLSSAGLLPERATCRPTCRPWLPSWRRRLAPV